MSDYDRRLQKALYGPSSHRQQDEEMRGRRVFRIPLSRFQSPPAEPARDRCPVCRGSGRIESIEYDEHDRPRMVSCGGCGGTGGR